MNFYIVFFLPCILGLWAYYVLSKDTKKFNLGIYYLLNVLFTNLGCILVLFLKDKTIYSLTTRLDGDYRFAFKYLVLGVFISFIFGVVSAIAKKYCSVSVEVKNGRKKKEEKN